MKKISEQARAFLRNQGIRFGRAKGGCFKAGLRDRNGTFFVIIDADDQNQLLGAYTICPLTIPKTKLMAVSELTARINCLLTLGNFEIDMEDGRILARTALKLGDTQLDNGTREGNIFHGWATMDYFFPAIASVLFTDISPREALDKLEDSERESSSGDKPRTEGFASSERFDRWMRYFSNN